LNIPTLPLSAAQILLKNSGAVFGLLPVQSSDWQGVFSINVTGKVQKKKKKKKKKHWSYLHEKNFSVGQVYGTSDLPSLFSKLGASGPFNLEKGFVAQSLLSPGVNCTVVYGSQVQTVVSANYADYNFNQPTMLYTASGDGTVPAVSATFPLRHWSASGLFSLELANVKHMNLISDPNFYRSMLSHASS
jgi:hypothetical protein